MNVTSVPLGSVVRNTSDLQSADGEMATLINMRHKGGSLEPMGTPTQVATCNLDMQIVHIHANTNYQNWIAYDGSVLSMIRHLEEGEDAVETLAVIESRTGITEVKSIGNTLIIIHATGIDYALFQEGSYRLIGDLHLPITLKPTLWKATVEEEYSTTSDAISSSDITDDDTLSDDMQTHVSGLLYKLMDEVTEDGYIYYPVLARYALRLYDGTHIHHSSPLLLMSPTLHHTELIATTTTNNLSSVTYTITITPHELQVSFVKDASFDASAYSDIVTHIDLFIAPITVLDYGQDYSVTFSTLDVPKLESLPYKATSEIVDEIEQISTFYKVASWEIEELDTLTGTVTVENLDTYLPYIEQQEQLELDDLSHHTITAACSYVYNNKLHLANIDTTLYEGHSLNSMAIYNSNYNGESTGISDPLYGTYPLASLEGYIYTTLSTSNGTSVVVNEFAGYDIYGINPLISYPDSRATQMDIYIKDGTYYKVYSFPLTASSVLNIAYYLDPTLTAIVPTYETDLAEADPSTDDACNTVESTPNKMRVSELDNPFAFPAEQTYTISNAAIVGMASTTQALSQGQFGQHPLYIFTKEGIWSMSVGEGDITYATSLPISREVCCNSNSITPIDNAVVFASSRGIQLLSASTVQCISQAIDGIPAQCYWIENELLPQTLNQTKSLTPITDMVASCQIGYNYSENELWIATDNTTFVWIYNLDYGTWSLNNTSVAHFIPCYPSLYYSYDARIYEINDQSSGNYNETIFITRPLKLESLGFKKLDHIELRLSGVTSTVSYSLYGSNNLHTYTPLGSVQCDQDSPHSIPMTPSHQAFRYFVVVLSANPEINSNFVQLDITFRNAYNNKLR